MAHHKGSVIGSQLGTCLLLPPSGQSNHVSLLPWLTKVEVFVLLVLKYGNIRCIFLSTPRLFHLCASPLSLVSVRATTKPRWLYNRWPQGTFHCGWWKPGHFSVPTGFCRDSGHATQNRDCPDKTRTSGRPRLPKLIYSEAKILPWCNSNVCPFAKL